MSVTVTQTAGRAAEIAWERADDPHGYLARAVQGDQLAYALQALGGSDQTQQDPSGALAAVTATAQLARLLERRAAVEVVRLRDDLGLSWRQIAAAIYEDADKQSSVRRMYDSGRRHLGR